MYEDKSVCNLSYCKERAVVHATLITDVEAVVGRYCNAHWTEVSRAFQGRKKYKPEEAHDD